MPQTLLAVLALVLASVVTLNQQRLRVRAHQTMVEEEMELAATGTSMNILELVAARSFDETTTPEGMEGESRLAPPTRPDGFARPNRFGWSGQCDLQFPVNTPGCDDVDDLHMSGRDEWVPVRVGLSGGNWLDFTAYVTVDYVTGVGGETPSSDPTLFKRVTLRMRSDLVDEGQRDILELRRVVAYDPVKAEYDYEQRYGRAMGEDTETP